MKRVVISKIQQYMMSGNFKILDTQSNRNWFYEAYATGDIRE